MQIFLNGNKREVSKGLTTEGLLDKLGLKDQHLAVEVNQELVMHSLFAKHVLKAGDRVEIIEAIGGG